MINLKEYFMNTEKITDQIKAKAESMNPYREEGTVAKAIETQTSRLPSDVFLWAAGGAMIASLTLKLLDRKHTALFLGQWAAPILLMGVYNKLVKVSGHDQLSNQPD
jgi:hypothetical protein